MLLTTLVISFCKDGTGSVNVKLCFLVVYVGREVLCRLVVAGNVFLLILIAPDDGHISARNMLSL